MKRKQVENMIKELIKSVNELNTDINNVNVSYSKVDSRNEAKEIIIKITFLN